MDQHLRCNSQHGGSCRTALTTEAIVTTCAHVLLMIHLAIIILTSSRHIFCIPCAEKTGLSTAPRNQRRCPVCKTDLPNAHDAVRNLVNPPEDFKTSVLCGFDPATIVECAQRALSFWTYQNAQEHAYQQHIARNLMQRYHQLNAEVERIVSDANTRIQALETQNQDLTADQQSMNQKYAQLFDQYQEKSKKQAQTQKLYDILKQKVMLEKIQPLADDDVAQTLQSMDALPQTKKQPIMASRRAVYPPEPLNIPQRSIPNYGRLQEGPERLHPHQRSGSSVGGSEQRGMLPPERPGISRIRTWPKVTGLFLLTRHSKSCDHFRNASATSNLTGSLSSGCPPSRRSSDRVAFSASG
ncbi:uncharacterized protein Z519_11824 [Cladophialophora bantiana CBS 173.52]|uniref:RING-type domain-containing protein n=1 Tax=Cladophialophora bantiana (strain ATCC 10958 / CBS 173.52 / CDC B-1940 / NIH 8579) TaxID=1442370 RepID=A0A0D2EBR3_CLAB1|nr:uncharacterized protein Z519_11824 [Cladophialophora bantiana CBS 173.52]KIW87501.1 hypothetical protein Z519_11824 [Cladophialophora bantiana CBS 173.52]